MRSINYSKSLGESRCARCGKLFYRAPEHLYKRNTHSQGVVYYCSYSCWTAAKRGN